MTNSPTRLVILGPQDVGKSTECALLRRLDLVQRARLDRRVMIKGAEYRSAVALGGPK
jgi:polynucleotide 5'-kinase involved in rRNA processing